MMDNEKQLTPRDIIRKSILKLEKANIAAKPDGLSDKEMVEKIKKIIEKEVGKWLLNHWLSTILDNLLNHKK